MRLLGNRKDAAWLPVELLIYIFEFLPIQDLLKVVQVCRLWDMAGYDEILWKTQSLKYFENPVNVKKRDIKKSSDENWKTYFAKKYIAHTQWKSANLTQTTLTGHSGTVWALAFDDQKLVTGSFDKTIKV